MAIPSEQKRAARANSFGDAAAAAGDPSVTTVRGAGEPAMSSADIARASASGPTPSGGLAAAGVYGRGMDAASNAARALMGVGEGVGTAGKIAGRASAAIAPAIEAVDVAKVAQDPRASGIDVATQAAQGTGRVAGALAGAGAGAAAGSALLPGVGTAAGALLGGYLGYQGADKAIEAGRRAVGTDPAAPADRAAWQAGSGGSASAATSSSPSAPREPRSAIAPITPSAAGAGRGFDTSAREAGGTPVPYVRGSAEEQVGGSASGRDVTRDLNKVPEKLPSDMREGVVVKTVDPSTGRTTYSGRNVGTNADGLTQMVDGAGKDLGMIGRPKGNFVQANDANGRPMAFATPESGGAIDLRGQRPPASPASPPAPSAASALPNYVPSSAGGSGARGSAPRDGAPAYPDRDANGITAQNHAAADALSNQSAARVQLSMAQDRYQQEVAAAQRTNQWVADRFNPPTRGELAARKMRLAEKSASAGQELEQQKLSQQDRQFSAKQGLDERKFGVDAAGASVDQRLKGTQADAAAQLLRVQQAAIDPRAAPAARRAAADQLMALQGKQADDFQVVHAAGGQQLDERGTPYKTPDRIIKFSKRTGAVEEVAPPRQQGPAPYKEGQALRGKDGRAYVVKNGQPVPQ